MLEALVAKYLSITVADDEGLEKFSRFNRTIDSFSASDCKIFFGTYSRNVFGRDWSAQSRAFKYFINHIYQNFKHLVNDNLQWWYRNGFFAASAEAIERKIGVDDHRNMITHRTYLQYVHLQ